MNKEDAKAKLAELTLKVDELQAIIDKPDITPWEPKGGSYLILNDGVAEFKSDEEHRKFGIERSTCEIATSARKDIIKYNRLLAYRDENDTPNHQGDGYIVIFDSSHSEFYVGTVSCPSLTDVVFNHKHNAELLIEKLQSGEVVL